MSSSMDDFKISFWDRFEEKKFFSHNVAVFFLLEGNLSVHFIKESYSLKREDFLIVNTNRICSFCEKEKSLLAVIEIDYKMLCRMTRRGKIYFSGNSTVDFSIKYEKFRYIIGELLNEYALNYGIMTFEKLIRFYRLCDYLTRYFTVRANQIEDNSNDDKLEQTLQYIENHYSQNLSLEKVSQFMYMTPTSFSRYFHKALGLTFSKYLNKIRLDYAIDMLLNTNQSITEIAFNVGFSNSSAFNKAFKKEYNCSPSDFKRNRDGQNSELEQEWGAILENTVEKYRNKTRLMVVKEQKVKELQVTADVNEATEMHNAWTEMIHLGNASQLLSAEYQRQIMILKTELGYTYGVVTGIFSSKMKLRNGHETEHLNFSYIDNVFDCLMKNKIRPLITLDNQLSSIVKDIEASKEEEEKNIFLSIEECLAVLDQMISHFVYRYGLDEVDEWGFDIWYNEFKEDTLGLPGDFYKIWDCIYHCIRIHLPNARIGGSGTGISVGYKRVRKFYEQWKQAVYQPDFISVNIFPYYQSENRKRIEVKRRKIEGFLQKDLEEMKEILADCQFAKKPIYVLQWNLSMVQRNFFNDTSGKAAIMLREIARNLNGAERITYWAASDLQAGDYDANRILNGACGFLSKDGLRKPAFYAMEFLGKLLRYRVATSDNCIITTDKKRHFALLLFNCKELNYSYYSRKESEISIQLTENIYIDEDVLEITLTLEEVANGKYYIHKQLMGPEHGDVLNEWKNLGIHLPTTMKDLVYLDHRSIPHRENNTITVDRKKLVLLERLAAHEIMLLQIDPVLY